MTKIQFVAFTGIAAAVAAAAAFSSLTLGLAPWAMFIGWVAYFTRPTSAPAGAASWLCLVLGLVLGAIAVASLRALTPALGPAAIAVVVFVVGMIVISMRATPVLDNVLAWFLGLIAFFASHLEPGFEAVAELGGASALGGVAGWAAQALQRRLTPAY
jgi:hypothetical protein